MAETPAAHLAAHDRAGTEPQHRHDAREHEEDGDCGQSRPRPQPLSRGGKRCFDGAGEPGRNILLIGERLHRAHGGKVLGGVGRGFGQGVLGFTRQPAHNPTIGNEGQDNSRNGEEHEGRELWARHEHHDEGADEHDQVAQCLAESGTGGGLDLRRVGRQAAHHLARVCDLVKGRAEPGHMPKDIGPHVGHDPLAKPVDQVEAGSARQR